jgi:hypothetical protein
MCDELDEATCESVPECVLVPFVQTRLHLGGNHSYTGLFPKCFEGVNPSETERIPIWDPTDPTARWYGFILGDQVPVGWLPCPHEDAVLPEQCEHTIWMTTQDVDAGEDG